LGERPSELGRFAEISLEQTPEKPHDLNGSKDKPESFKEKFFEWWEDAPRLIQRGDDS